MIHGTNACYNNLPCRCGPCKSAHATVARNAREYARQYYQTKREKILEQKKKYEAEHRDEILSKQEARRRAKGIQPAKDRNWMDRRAEEVWEKLRDKVQEPMRWGRSPLCDL